MVEALATAHRLAVGIAVSDTDVGPDLRAAAEADGIAAALAEIPIDEQKP